MGLLPQVVTNMRATVDLDNPSISQVRESWEILKRHGDKHVYGRVSSSDTGVHLKVHSCDPDNVRAIRIAAGDDRKRLGYDSKTVAKPKQILFSEKRGKSASEWSDSLEEVIDQYSQIAPAAYERKMLLAIYPVTRGII